MRHGSRRWRGRSALAGAPALAGILALALASPVGAAPLVHPGGEQSAASAGASARPAPRRGGVAMKVSATQPYFACPHGLCDAIIDPRAVKVHKKRGARFALPAGGPLLEGDGEKGGLDPQDLQSAYKIPTSGGEGQTIALIDAFGYKTAESDLAAYRARYGLPACTSKNHCFAHVNQAGAASGTRSGGHEGWESESALDLDMASAACPGCHILLVDAVKSSWKELGEALDTAVALGATEISNSYGEIEQACATEAECHESASAYSHPGVLITVSAGDRGYDNEYELVHTPNYPASLPSVVAVGGTSLRKAANPRGWAEEVWNEPRLEGGTGSGCSSGAASQEKPLWQADVGCADRTDGDVAAVAACETPVSVYVRGSWENVCGTSASSPLVAGIEAHASAYARSLPGADAFYNDPAALFDVTSGSNGMCVPPAGAEYLCRAEAGYDGPTGNGTPDGPLQLTAAPPAVRTGAASAVTETSATLNGAVQPQALATSYQFEYGTSNTYGQRVPLAEASAGSGLAPQTVSEPLSDLVPQTVYHYRLLATNAAGTSYGRDQEFSDALPVVAEVSPGAAPSDAGPTVTIGGANFVAVTAVRFGTTPATSFTVTSPTSITAVAPREVEGPVTVSVTTVAGTSASDPGDEFTFALGAVFAWGKDQGDLGRGFEPTVSSPAPVEVDSLPEATSLAAGVQQSYAVLRDGEVMSWGKSNLDGELGNGLSPAEQSTDLPAHVCAAEVTECPGGPYLTEATQVVAGSWYAMALLRNGNVVAWGDAPQGSSNVPLTVCAVTEFPCSPEHHLSEVTAIAAGGQTAYALLRNGTVVAWGNGEDGELGDGTTSAFREAPVPVSGITEATAIAAGSDTVMALLRSGEVLAWGNNESGQLGDDATEASDVPVHVCAPEPTTPCSTRLSGVRAISAGRHDGYALLSDGTVVSWGAARWGQLGSGETGGGETHGPEFCLATGGKQEPCSRIPLEVAGLHEAAAIAAGVEGNAIAVTRHGELLTWGENNWGELGAGSKGNSDSPVHVCAVYADTGCPEGPYLSGEVTAVAAAGQHDLVSLAGGP